MSALLATIPTSFLVLMAIVLLGFFVETVAGFAAIGWNAKGINSFRLPAGTARETEGSLLRRLADAKSASPPPPVQAVIDDALRYFAGERVDFTGVPVDHSDGFIHFSTAAQVAETARRHYAGRANLVLLWIDAPALGAALRWEPSRGGALFPHLYGSLPASAVLKVAPLPLGADGSHVFPNSSDW